MRVTDWSGAEYARLSGLQRTMIDEAMAGLRFGSDDVVLDIGCGDGFLTRAIAGLAPDGTVVGADPSRRMIATAEAAATPAASGPWFVVADVRALPFARDVDAVVSFNALHWVPEQETALRQIAGVLRPGATAIVQMVCAGHRPSLEDITMELCRTPRWAPWFDGFAAPYVHVAPDQWTELAATVGLVTDDLMVRDREWDFGSRDAFLQWSAMGSTAWTDRLPEDDRAEFIQTQVDLYEAITGAAGLFRFMQMRARLHRQEA